MDVLNPVNIVLSLAGTAALTWLLGGRRHSLKRAAGGLAPCESTPALLLFMGAILAGAGTLAVHGLLFGPVRDIAATAPGAEALAQQVRLQLSQYLCQSAFIAAFAWASLTGSKPAEARRGRHVRVVTSIAITIAAFICILPIVTLTQLVVTVLWTALGLGDVPAIAHTTLQSLVASPTDRWFLLSILNAAVAAPIFEEVIYRGWLQGGLRRLGFGPWRSITLTSTVFAAVHASAVPAPALAAIFTLSLGFGWAFDRTGRLWASIAMHMLFNAFNLVVTLTIYR